MDGLCLVSSVNQINDLFEINLGCELLTVSNSKLIVSNLLWSS